MKRVFLVGLCWAMFATPGVIRAESGPGGVQEFFDAFWQAQASNNAGEWASFFASSSSYQYAVGGVATRTEVANDREKLVLRYPKRIYQQTGEPKVTPDGHTLRIRYSYAYRYKGRRDASGRTTDTLTVRPAGDRWSIVGYTEAVRRD